MMPAIAAPIRAREDLDARGGDRRAASRPAGDAGSRRRPPHLARAVGRRRGRRGRCAADARIGRRSCCAVVHARVEPTHEWCDRRLLARIHRYTLNRLRAEIEPVTPADFMRFLFAWQHVASAHRLTGLDGLRAMVAQLDGVELAAGAWERHSCRPRRSLRAVHARHALPDRRGGVGAALGRPVRPHGRRAAATIRSTPVALFLREHQSAWHALSVAPTRASLPRERPAPTPRRARAARAARGVVPARDRVRRPSVG